METRKKYIIKGGMIYEKILIMKDARALYPKRFYKNAPPENF